MKRPLLLLLLFGGSRIFLLVVLAPPSASAFQPPQQPQQRIRGSPDLRQKQQQSPSCTATATRLCAAASDKNRKDEESRGQGDVYEGEEDDDDEDFAGWIQGLGEQWPLKMQQQQDGDRGEQQRQQQGNAPDGGALQQKQLPLTNLLNMEALLALGQQSESFQKMNATAQAAQESLLTSLLGGDSPSKIIGISGLDGLISPIDTIVAAAKGGIVLNITELSNLGTWVDGLQRSLLGPYGYLQEENQQQVVGKEQKKEPDSYFTMKGLSAESVLKAATDQIESIVKRASGAVMSIKTMEELIADASEILEQSSASASKSINGTQTNIIQAATDYAVQQGLDVDIVTSRAKETIEFSKSFVTVADSVYRKGYVVGDGDKDIPADSTTIEEEPAVLPESVLPPVKGSRALFADFESAAEISDDDVLSSSTSIPIAATMGALAGSIYEDSLSEKLELGHTIVAEGATDDVRWMVTDSISDEASFRGSSSGDDVGEGSSSESQPLLIRTITIRGYDASDGEVDREDLLFRVVDGDPTSIPECKDLVFHSGLLGIARSMYKDLEQYIHWTAPNHKIVLNGHSIGGSLSLMLLFLMTLDLGPEVVKQKVMRVFTFGSPPIVRMKDADKYEQMMSKSSVDPILDTFELPCSMVEGYVQGWDPITRLFTPLDPLYPLVDDVAEDGYTLWQSGPPRTLRPLLKAVLEAWDGWSTCRDTFLGSSRTALSYSPVGMQHVLVPDPTRYLADRFVAVNIPVPPVDTIVRIAPGELLPALSTTFPLDVFEISYVPQTIRSFVHHFYPAYAIPIVEYVKRLEEESAEGAMDTSNIDSQQLQRSTASSGDEGVNGEQRPRDRTSGWSQRFRI